MHVKQGTFIAPATTTGNQVVSWSNAGNWPTSATPQVVLFWCACASVTNQSAGAVMCMGAAKSSTERWSVAIADDDVVAAQNAGQFGRTNACIHLLMNGNPATMKLADFVSFGS